MLTDAQLETLLTDLESDRVERKSTLAGDASERIREAICAFANDLPNHRKPGVVFVGASDDGSPSGLSVTDDLLRQLSQMKDDGNILPLPTLTVAKRLVRGQELAVVEVMPSDSPPVRYRGRVWIRVGPRRAVASIEEERRLSERRRFHDQPFDARPASSATIQDLDRLLFEQTYLPALVARDVLLQNDRSYEDRLASARFTTPPPELLPTNCGILVVGAEPVRFLPGAYVQFVRLGGVSITDPVIHQTEVHGPLPQLLFRFRGGSERKPVRGGRDCLANHAG